MTRRLIYIFLIACLAGLAMPAYAQLSPIAPPPPLESLHPEDIQISIPPLARSIDFKGNTLVSSSDLKQVAGIKSGQLINQDILGRAIDNIQYYYQEQGYVAAVTGVELPKPGQIGTLIFVISELRVSEIKFEGLKKVKDNAVRRLLRIKPGDYFDHAAIYCDSKQIQQMGVFDSIVPELQPTGKPGEAMLVWKLDEKTQFNYADMGGSYAPQDGLIGEVNLTFGNVGGKAQQLLLSGEMGSVESQAGGRVKYFTPWIAPNNTSLLIDAFSVPRYRFSTDLAGIGRYYERRSGFQTTISRMRNSLETESKGLRYENVNAHNLPSADLTDPTIQSGSLVIASLKDTFDHRNSTIDPTFGAYSIGEVDCGYSSQKNGDSGMIGKLMIDQRVFLPFKGAPNGNPYTWTARVPVLAIRQLLGATAGNLPYYEQYFVGGVGDLPLRGYEESRFWGKYAFLTSVEFRYPIGKKLGALAFVDAGDAWGSEFQYTSGISTDYSQHKKISPRVGTGVGLRYNASIGLMSLDFAYGDDFHTYFSIGQLF